MDENPKIFLTDPSGTYLAYNAVAIGSGHDQVTEFLEKTYDSDISLEDACVLAIKSIYLVSEDKVGISHIKMASIDMATKRMRMLSEEEIARYSQKARQ